MQVTTYKCDECGKVLSDDKAAIPHLSIKFGYPSGHVEKSSGAWRFTTKLNEYLRVVHFCNLSHFTKWLAQRLNLEEPDASDTA